MNDVCLRNEAVSVAEAYRDAGYDTACIGKWHLDGHGRTSFIPCERRQGFDFWKVLECTHNYNNSPYYADENVKLKWDGYDAIAQTREAQRYIREHDTDKPFLMVISWGPPHNPYETAPEQYRKLYDPERIELRANVPGRLAPKARRELAGYYAHISALDACVADLLETLRECGIDDNTIFVFTSDHGDMLHSQGQQRKQKPYDEAIRVPFLLRYPARLGNTGRELDTLLNTPDITPTLLGLSGVPVPDSMEGTDFSAALLGGEAPDVDAALIMCPAPFGEWTRKRGGREYRGVRTKRHTYCRDLNGPWILYDNEKDPYQQENVCGRAEYAEIQAELDGILNRKLEETNDEFRDAAHYIQKWGYTVDESGTVPYGP
jgi:arylsulfatase A-like enzyme